MASKFSRCLTPYCVGMVEDNPADERAICMMCGKGVDYTKGNLYLYEGLPDKGRERHYISNRGAAFRKEHESDW